MTATEGVLGIGVAGGALGMAVLTGGAGALIVSAAAGAVAYAAHDGIVGSMYQDAACNLKRELEECKDEGKAVELRRSLDKMKAESALVKMASVAAGIGTFICPPVGMAATAALAVGLARRI